MGNAARRAEYHDHVRNHLTPRRIAAVVASLALGLAAASCTSPQPKPGSATPPTTNPTPQAAQLTEKLVDPLALTGEIRQAMDAWYAKMIGLATQIMADAENREVREAALRLKIRTANAVQFVLMQNDARQALLSSWIMAVQFRQLMTSDEGRARFGDQADVLAAAAKEAEDGVRGIVAKYFSPEQVEAAAPEVEDLATRNVLSDRFAMDYLRPDAPQVVAGEKRSGLSRLLGVPLAPVSGLQGVADTPTAINNIARAINDFTLTTRQWAERARWQIELLLFEAQDLQVVRDTRQDFDRLSRAFDTLAAKVDTLPEDLREQIVVLFDESQAVRDTLSEVRRTLETLQPVLKDANALATQVTQLTEEVRAMQAPKPVDPDAPPKNPEDEVSLAKINDAIGQAALLTAELRGLMDEFRGPLPEDAAITQTLARTQAAADDLVESLTWRGLLLIGAALVAALVYRLVAVKLLPRRERAAR